MSGLYEATALALRFWFLVVAVIIVLGVTSISIKEYRDKRMVLDQNTIGRSRHADIIFADRSVDKAHSQIYLSEDGTVTVNRLGRGDVTVNGVSLDGSAPLKNRDIVCFGNVVAKVFLKEG